MTCSSFCTEYMKFIRCVANETAPTTIVGFNDYVQAASLILCKLFHKSDQLPNKQYVKQCIRNAIIDERLRCTGSISGSLNIKKKAIKIISRCCSGESISTICSHMNLTTNQFYDLVRLVAKYPIPLYDLDIEDALHIKKEDFLHIANLTNEEQIILLMKIDGYTSKEIANRFNASIRQIHGRIRIIRRKVLAHEHGS